MDLLTTIILRSRGEICNRIARVGSWREENLSRKDAKVKTQRRRGSALRLCVFTFASLRETNAYGLTTLKLSKITVPGDVDSTCHVPALSSNITDASGIVAVSQGSL